MRLGAALASLSFFVVMDWVNGEKWGGKGELTLWQHSMDSSVATQRFLNLEAKYVLLSKNEV